VSAPPRAPVEQRTLAIALLASLLLWNLPFGGVLLYPFKLLATWLHELSHGLAMLLTGAGLDHVVVYRDTSGLAYPRGGTGPIGAVLVAAAGYMGTPLWGALLLVVTPTARAARWALLVLAALLVGTALTVIAAPHADPGDHFGPWAIGAIGAGVAAAAVLVPARWRLATRALPRRAGVRERAARHPRAAAPDADDRRPRRARVRRHEHGGGDVRHDRAVGRVHVGRAVARVVARDPLRRARQWIAGVDARSAARADHGRASRWK